MQSNAKYIPLCFIPCITQQFAQIYNFLHILINNTAMLKMLRLQHTFDIFLHFTHVSQCFSPVTNTIITFGINDIFSLLRP